MPSNGATTGPAGRHKPRISDHIHRLPDGGVRAVSPGGIESYFDRLGRLHRLDGPAIVWPEGWGGHREWWIDGIELDEFEHAVAARARRPGAVVEGPVAASGTGREWWREHRRQQRR